MIYTDNINPQDNVRTMIPGTSEAKQLHGRVTWTGIREVHGERRRFAWVKDEEGFEDEWPVEWLERI